LATETEIHRLESRLLSRELIWYFTLVETSIYTSWHFKPTIYNIKNFRFANYHGDTYNISAQKGSDTSSCFICCISRHLSTSSKNTGVWTYGCFLAFSLPNVERYTIFHIGVLWIVKPCSNAVVHTEDGNSMIVRILGILPHHSTASQTRRPRIEYSSPWKPQTLHCHFSFHQFCSVMNKLNFIFQFANFSWK